MTRRRCLAGLAFVLAFASTTPVHADKPRGPDEAPSADPKPAPADPGSSGCASLAKTARAESSGDQLKLAECYERHGKTGSAWLHFTAAATAAANGKDVAKERLARERAARLAPLVDRIVVSPPPLPDVEVERDGRVLPRSEWGKEIAVDPGEHTVHIAAPGKTSFDSLVTARGTGALVRIDVPQLEPALPWRLQPGVTTGHRLDTPAERAESPAVAPSDKRAQSPATPRSLKSLEYWGYGFAIGGLLSIGGGAALYASARSDEGSCSEGRCVLSAALLSTGGAALILGTVLVLVSVAER